jgi:hypothetical protein
LFVAGHFAKAGIATTVLAEQAYGKLNSVATCPVAQIAASFSAVVGVRQ